MAEAVDAFPQDFVLLLQDEVPLLQPRLLLPQTPEVERPSFAKDRKEG